MRIVGPFDPRDCYCDRVCDEAVPVCDLVDLLPVRRVHIVPAERRVNRPRTHLVDNLPQRARNIPSPTERCERRKSRVRVAFYEALLDLLDHQRLAELDIRRLQPAIMDIVLNIPAQRLVQILRPRGVCQVLLSPDNVAHAEQMIIDSRSKVEQGPDPILRADPRMRILYGIDNTKRGPVPDRRVRMSQIRLYSKHRFSLSRPSIQHLLPVRQVLLRTLRTIGTRSAIVDVE